MFQGTQYEGTNAMRFAGYADPSPQSLLQLGSKKVGDAQLQLTDAEHRARAEAVDMHHQDPEAPGAVHPRVAGCSGTSPLAHPLSYADYNNLFMLPIYHTGCQLLSTLICRFCILLSQGQQHWCTFSQQNAGVCF